MSETTPTGQAESGNAATAGILRRLRARPERVWTVTPATFANKLSKGKWVPAKHLEYISSVIASAVYKGLTYGESSYIIISVPPRHGKSREVSIWTPLWILEHWPWANVMLATYASDLANDFSRETRDLAIEHGDAGILSFRLRQDVRKTERWMTDQDGGMFAVGVGGPITGRGANVLLIDDYIKNIQEASSRATRDAIWDWWLSTASTRLEPGGVAVIVATRWDEDDLIGRIQENDKATPWQIIRLPALAEENDPLGRKVGEPLWPERYTERTLKGIRARIGSHFWNALYQQDPQKAKAGIYQGELIPDIPLESMPSLASLIKVWYWDTAATPVEVNPKADETVGTLSGLNLNTGEEIILKQVGLRVSVGKVEKAIHEYAQLTGKGTWIFVEEEPGSAGKGWVHSIQKECKGYRIEGLKSTGSKFVKAQPFFAAAENGRVKMIRAPWNKDLRKQIEDFPDGEFDDRVDSAAGAHRGLMERVPKWKTSWGRASSTGQREEDRIILSSGATFGRNSEQDVEEARKKIESGIIRVIRSS